MNLVSCPIADRLPLYPVLRLCLSHIMYVFFHSILSVLSSLTIVFPVSYFVPNYFRVHFHAFAVSCLEFCLFYLWQFIVSLLLYFPFPSFSPCFSSHRPIHHLLAFIITIYFFCLLPLVKRAFHNGAVAHALQIA